MTRFLNIPLTDIQLCIISYLEDKIITQAELVKKLRIKGFLVNSRDVRKQINAINHMFINGEVFFVIIGTTQGNKLTRNEKEITEFNKKRKKHALSELYMSYQTEKRIFLNKNLTFDEYLDSLRSLENENIRKIYD